MDALGSAYKSILSTPFKIGNLPFKSYRELYGKPKNSEQYQGTFLQKQRLKRVIPLILKGKNLNDSDKLFMDMFNSFLTEEGAEPIDQSHTTMDCQNKNKCNPYIFKKIFFSKQEFNKIDGEEDVPKRSSSSKTYKIEFHSDLKPKNGKKSFKKGNIYRLSLIKIKKTHEHTEFYFKNSFLEEDDYLIFKTKVKDPIGRAIYYTVSQNNSKRPLNHDIDLGGISVKIY